MKNNSLTILQTPVRFNPYIGGVENHVYYLSKELVKLGYNVKVICADEPESSKKIVDGISVERLKYIFKITNTNICLSLPFQIIKSHFDIIHTHMPTPWTADWSVLLTKIMRKKSVLTIHNDMDKSSLISKIVTKVYLNTVFKITLSLVDKIIIVNPNWKKSFISTGLILAKYENKISIIPNGVDLSLFNKSKENRKKNTILFVSILDKHHSFKGLDYLLEALVSVSKSFPDVNLLIVGEGEMKKNYELKAKQLKIDKHITFVGEINQNELSDYYNKASLFVLPSTEIEGFGIVLLEAMACSLPVITTNIAGVWKDIKDYNAGIIVKPRDSIELSNAIISILKNSKKADLVGRNGNKLIKEKYDWKIIANQIKSLYKEIHQ